MFGQNFFDVPLDQHARIHAGLIKLLNYTAATSTQPAEYRLETMKDHIESSAPELHRHQEDEINLLLEPRAVESEAVAQCFKQVEKVATNDISLELSNIVFPVVLGASDQTYEDGHDWPRLPAPSAIKYWFSRHRKGA